MKIKNLTINFNNKKFNIIGSAHNQLEYFIKLNQNCKLLFLSRLFYNNKIFNK